MITISLIASAPGANNLRGSKPFPSRSFPASIYLRVASANASWHSVLTLILATPREIAFLIMSSGIPVPPCNTNGMSPVNCWIASNVSKLNPSQFSGYFPWMFPIPAASIVTPRSATALHSSGSAHSPLPITPSSSPPIDPTSASIDIPFPVATFTSSFVFSTFSSIG